MGRLSPIGYAVHSDNPVGKANIHRAMQRIEKDCREAMRDA